MDVALIFTTALSAEAFGTGFSTSSNFPFLNTQASMMFSPYTRLKRL
jgi:hypothetical protein